MDAGGTEEESGGSGSNVFGEAPVAPVVLNLTALMDILSNLLFFLLAAFGATVVMAINATVPVRSSEGSDVASTRLTVTAMVNVSDTSTEVTITGTEQAQADLDRWHAKFGPVTTPSEAAAFTARLVEIKEQYPKSDTMILSADPGTKYEVMIKTMDSSRESVVTVSDTPRMVPLFPTVVVSPGAGK